MEGKRDRDCLGINVTIHGQPAVEARELEQAGCSKQCGSGVPSNFCSLSTHGRRALENSPFENSGKDGGNLNDFNKRQQKALEH
jgi:hypothetical protein